MNRAALIFCLTLACFCAAFFPVSGAEGRDGDCKAAALKIVRFARANGVDKISVLDFTPKSGVEKNEADYISEKLGSYLAGYKKPVLIERALLEKVLKESRLSSAAGEPADKAKMLAEIFSIDAVVTGTVFNAGEKLKILTRLIDVRTGRVLLAAQAEAEREWPQFPEVPDTGFRWESAAWPPPPDFRDSLSDAGKNSCDDRKLRLTRLNSELVDTKALYWAAKMKGPGFSIRGLTKNPGTEITDPETKARFYKLLTAYYKAENAPPPEPDKLPALIDLIEEETRVADECGYR